MDLRDSQHWLGGDLVVVYYESRKRELKKREIRWIVVYYETLKRALKTKTIDGYRCDERLKTNVEESFLSFFFKKRKAWEEGECRVHRHGGPNEAEDWQEVSLIVRNIHSKERKRSLLLFVCRRGCRHGGTSRRCILHGDRNAILGDASGSAPCGGSRFDKL
jgi:hypothetical protein